MSDVSAPRTDWKNIRASLLIGGAQVAGALLLTFARKQGWIDAEGVTRGVMVIIGLGLAATAVAGGQNHEAQGQDRQGAQGLCHAGSQGGFGRTGRPVYPKAGGWLHNGA